MEQAKIFFEQFIGKEAFSFELLAQSGSARINWKAKNEDKNYIITYNENLRENDAFFYFSELFSELNLNTPKIFKISEDRKIYIQEYLGDHTLSEIIEKEGLSERVKNLVKQSLDQLFLLQQKTKGIIDFKKTFEYEKYDELPIMHDLYYFKSFMADVLEIPYHKSTLLKEFKEITSEIETLQPKVIMIRDFQSRNIMVDQDNVFFIDYQSAMEGPAMYDVISFLYQAKANFPETFQNEMLNYYISLYGDEEIGKQLNHSVKYIQLIRFLQVLGAYGFRGLIQRKAHFIKSIGKGIENISELSTNWKDLKKYPELQQLIQNLASEETSKKINNLLNIQ